MFASKKRLLMLACLFLPSLVWAAGLGKLSVLSALGAPLRAEIEVVSLQQGEGDSLSVKLASAAAFRQANVELNGALLAVKFAIERRPSGEYFVVLTSTQPINEPFIDMLVEFGWSSGRLVREYTFLLDPPEYKVPVQQAAQVRQAAPALPIAPAQPVAPTEAPPAPAQARAEAPTQPSPAEAPQVPGQAQVEAPQVLAPVQAEAPQAQLLPAESPPAQAQPEVVAPVAAPGTTYEVKRGDTLVKIAKRNRIEGVTLQRMLVALLRANQSAFIRDNMNLLRAGKILDIPDKDAAASVRADDARRIVAAQSAEFVEYRRSLGAAVAATPARPEGGRQVSGQIGAPGAEQAAPLTPPAKDQLRLTQADDARRGGKAASAVLADDLAAKDKALNEANERVTALEKNVQNLQNLLQLKSSSGTQLQQQAQTAKSAQPEPSAKSAQAEPPVAKAAPTAKAAPAAPAETAKASEPAKVAETPKVEPDKAPEVAKVEAPKEAPKAGPKVAPMPPEPNFVDELLENLYVLIAGIAAILGLIGYAVFKWRRKRQTGIENSVTGTPSDVDSVLGPAGGRNIDTGSSSFQSDFSQGGIGKVDAEEIDPIAEADVYMAYGRDAQAEEILKEALAKDSSRPAIRVKLLEIFANRKDRKAFEAAATELRAATGGQGPEWGKAVSLGLSIDPQNPLYGGSGGARVGETPPASLDNTQILDVTVAETASAITQPEGDFGASLNIDFNLDTGAAPARLPDVNLDMPTQTDASPAAGLDFDLGLGGNKPAAPNIDFTAALIRGDAASPHGAAPASDGGLSIDFDLPGASGGTVQSVAQPGHAAASGGIDFDLGFAGGIAQAEAPKAPEMGLSAISLDLGTPGGGNGSGGVPDARWQEVATKLDLAKAYEEMGDKDGARELLNEVVKEGDAAQQQQAQTRLQALG
jgi:pilus assembly protein FimV